MQLQYDYAETPASPCLSGHNEAAFFPALLLSEKQTCGSYDIVVDT
jgi:hypothetical protein